MRKLAILYGGFVNISANKGDAVHALELTRNLRRLMSRLILFAWSLLRARISVMTISSGCDILYMRDYLFCAIGLGAKLLYSKKIVWEVNGIASYERAQKPQRFNALLLPVIRFFEMLANIGADRIIAVSKGVMDVLLKRGCPRSKVVLIENGVNIEMFSGSVEPSLVEQEKKRWGIPLSVPVVCYVGAIRPWQGLETLIEAAPIIGRNLEEVRFLIVGGGEGLADLKRTAVEKGLSSMFTFTGAIPYERVPLMIALSNICVAPFVRMRAASPMKVYEYMASGKPVVVSRIPGLEFIEERKLGLLVTPGEPQELARALIRVLKDPSFARGMADRAQQYARDNCSWSAVARRIMSLIREF